MRGNINSIGDTLTLTAGRYPDRTAIDRLWRQQSHVS